MSTCPAMADRAGRGAICHRPLEDLGIGVRTFCRLWSSFLDRGWLSHWSLRAAPRSWVPHLTAVGPGGGSFSRAEWSPTRTHPTGGRLEAAACSNRRTADRPGRRSPTHCLIGCTALSSTSLMPCTRGSRCQYQLHYRLRAVTVSPLPTTAAFTGPERRSRTKASPSNSARAGIGG